MNGQLWAAVLFWTVAVFGLVLCECLRTFSRSRLLAVCKRRGHEARFRDILERDEQGLVLAHAATVGALIIATSLSVAAAPEIASSVGTIPELLVRLIGCFAVSTFLLAIIPWAISQVVAEWFVDRSWPLVMLALLVCRPIVAVAVWTQTIVYRLAGRQETDNETDHISEEIDAVVDEGERDGTIEEGVSQMIQRVVDLQNVDVRDVMTPRTAIVTLQVETDFQEARERFIEAGHSRIPVIGDSPDDLLGVVYAKDFLHAADNAPDIKSLLREPLIIPESTPVDQLLERMRQRRMHIAIVLDEYGGVVGLVTLEDILEEIVGDISDEYDPEIEDNEIVRIDDRTIEVDAKIHVDDLNDQFEFDLPEDDDFETIGGFVFSQMGHVPDAGESLVHQGLKITVLEADRRKIVRLQIHRLGVVNV